LAAAMVSTLKEKHNSTVLKRRAQDFSVSKISKQYLDYFELKTNG
jgi:hypothetical protein